jgi:pyridoxamine 5'-phosphate oxidase like protein
LVPKATFKRSQEHLSDAQLKDLQNWEGNAQSFRILTQIENYRDDGGLQLTCATLGTGMKYPWAVTSARNGKFGFFQAEQDYAAEVADELGLEPAIGGGWCRHPLEGNRAIATFASKGHDLFAAIHGRLSADNDRAVIDRLWNRYVAAWFEGGKEDPKLVLLRLDPERAEIWGDASSFIAGMKLLLGIDPKKDYKDKVAEVDLR